MRIEDARQSLKALEKGLSNKDVGLNVTECCKEALRYFISDRERCEQEITKTPNLSSSHED